MTERKDYGKALLFWWFTGGIGGHRIYIQERISIVFWYWALNLCTLGIFGLVDAFRLRSLIDFKFEMDRQAEKMKRNMEELDDFLKESK
jgi:hypothetical protein